MNKWGGVKEMFRAGNEKMGNQMLTLPVAAGRILKENTIAVINNDGYAEPATKSTGLKVIGRVQSPCDNTAGQNGDQQVSVKRGCFLWQQDGTIKNTDIMKKCYIKDPITVTLTEESSSPAGMIIGLEETYVIVDMTQA